MSKEATEFQEFASFRPLEQGDSYVIQRSNHQMVHPMKYQQ
jgi:hypothetical protein